MNLAAVAAQLPDGWAGRILADFGCVRLKLFKADAAGLAGEVHSDWDEAILMLDGELVLELDQVPVCLKAGDFHLIPRGVRHRILPGCSGSFILLDPEPAA
ncbi:MAG: cupin domain-containing protein [Pseudomonadota bacterium]